MRVVGGTARGRHLRAPSSGSTRPTGDRVREALFSMLTSLDRIEGSTVLDLFAGSGALGIESLSRGAARAVFVDSSAEAVAAIRENLAVLGPDQDKATVVRSDALRFLAGAPGFDLVLADPPYSYDRWPELLDLLVGGTGLLVAETGSPWEPGPGWETVKVKKYGGTVVSIAQPAVPVSVPPAEEGEI
ncbi:MAG TPA: 16S rRNA (guanine(966)-N(2))-methyltransferase RsmD [Acidimicrobiales bacterium]|nr:16S rRNA (guanine(966)-N(2))-methyltransferase RsmD [Acidimicrobiales bacterium]